MDYESIVLTEEQIQAQPALQADSSKQAPLCPVCRSGWCHVNTENFLECTDCHVQFKDVTNAEATASPLSGLENTGGITLFENTTCTNDDGTQYDGTVYETCGYQLIPRLDVLLDEPGSEKSDSDSEPQPRDPNDPQRREFLLGDGNFKQ